jgi:hypothetical protein
MKDIKSKIFLITNPVKIKYKNTLTAKFYAKFAKKKEITQSSTEETQSYTEKLNK